MTGGEAEIALDAEAIWQPHQGDFAERKEPEFGTAEPQIGEAEQGTVIRARSVTTAIRSQRCTAWRANSRAACCRQRNRSGWSG